MGRVSAGISQIICGDCIEEMKRLEANSIDSVVCDPPYGINFMQKKWDEYTPESFQEFSNQWGLQAFRILKPGGYLLAFSGTRTYHRMVVGLEDAGFKIKDQLCYMYGAGFPKSLNLSLAINKYLGGEVEEGEMKIDIDGKPRSSRVPNDKWNLFDDNQVDYNAYEKIPTHPEALKWLGYGTMLKPAFEPIVMAQKPYEKTYAENVLKYGVGGLNIDACRINYAQEKETDNRIYNQEKNITRGSHGEESFVKYAPDGNEFPMYNSNKGRFPANLILSHHAECRLIGSKKDPNSRKNKVKHTKGKESMLFPFGNDNNPHGVSEDTVYNIYACHPDCPVRLLDEQSGELGKSGRPNLQGKDYKSNGMFKGGQFNIQHNDKGGASRYFKTVAYNDSFIKNDPLFKLWQKKMLGDILESQIIDGIVNGVIKEVERFSLNLSTDGYGSKIMEKYLKDILFTIKILTKQIINSKISNYYLEKNIIYYIESIDKIIFSLKELNIEDVKNVKNISHLQNFIKELLELMEDIVKNVKTIILENGERKTENIGTNTIENIGKISRFIYSGKAHKSERNAGLEVLEGGYLFDKETLDNTKKGRIMQREHMYCGKCGGDFSKEGTEGRKGGRKKKCQCKEPHLEWKVDPNETKNNIATLKPINVMRWLVRLVTPKGGTVLDPFAGSGTTGIAAIIEGFNYILIEKRERFAEVIIPKRLEFWKDPNNWELLKEHPLLPKPKILKNKKQNKGIEAFF